jgi:hypothetical protein
MKAALIPPIPHLDEFGRGDFHLLLAHLLLHPKYKNHYKTQREHGAYLVLDNSAHENGKGQDPVRLLKMGFDLDAQEIVVPDVLDDAGATVECCLAAHEAWFESGNAILDTYSPAFMYVPQGKNEEEWRQCLLDLVQIHSYCSRKYSLRRDFVIGVSKDYDVWDGGLLKLIDEHIYPLRNQALERGVRVQVHLLGWMRDLWALKEIADKHSWLRSTDSAKPFVYAGANIDLLAAYNKYEVPEYPKRKPDYFYTKLNRKQIDMAHNNAWMFRETAI